MNRPPDAGFLWNRSLLSAGPFNLSATLTSGQNFRWRQDAVGIWWGVIEQTIVAAWQTEDNPDSPLYWQTFPQPDQYNLIADYFRLDVDLETLYTLWTHTEPRIEPAVKDYRGLRILRQPPIECLFAFQCAACNTVVKIERSVAYLAAAYGEPISPGPSVQPMNSSGSAPLLFHTFPTLDALAAADEMVLRRGLWGYRAPRVIGLARKLLTLQKGWLESLRHVPYSEAHAALSSLFGIGAKLADCICLFALDKDEAVPVDTHIRQIAVRLFVPELAAKTLTSRVYSAIADAYRVRFSVCAGWAQQYLFFNQLNLKKS